MSFHRKEINEILIRVKQGDEQSKNELYQRTYNHMKVIAKRYLKNKNDVEDVVATAFMRIFNGIGLFDQEKDGYNWMYETVKNVAFDYNSKAKPWVPFENCPEPAANVGVEEMIAQKDEIEKCLQEYSEEDRELIYSRFFEGAKYREIAQKTGLKISTIHKRVSRILKEILKNNKNK